MNSVTKRLSEIAIAAVLLILCGCSSNVLRQQFDQPLDDHYPAITKGEQWEYSLEYTTPSAGLQRGTLTVSADAEEQINGKYYLRTVTSFTGVSDFAASYTYYRKTAQGIYTIYGSHINAPEFVETPFPLTIGKTWVVPHPDGALQYTAENIETVQAANQRYENCLKVSFRSQDQQSGFEGYSYHSPDFGEVKRVMKLNGSTIVYILKNHKPGRGYPTSASR